MAASKLKSKNAKIKGSVSQRVFISVSFCLIKLVARKISIPTQKPAMRYIPKKFSLSNNLLKSTNITLRGPCGKTWPAKLKSRGGKVKSKSYACILDGWKEFAMYYHLKVRDVCSFRFIRLPTSYSFMVDVKKILPVN
nr:B3 domain-containing protein REM9-like [Ipomoea batatas]